jgi:hypothetical protein
MSHLGHKHAYHSKIIQGYPILNKRSLQTPIKQSTKSTPKTARKLPLNKCKLPLNKCKLPLNMWMQTSKFQLTSSEFSLSSPLLPLVDNV